MTVMVSQKCEYISSLSMVPAIYHVNAWSFLLGHWVLQLVAVDDAEVHS